HRVHSLRQPDDRVDRTGLDALGAADAIGRHDACEQARPFCSAFGVEGQWLAPECGGKPGNAPCAAGRAAVDRGCITDDRLGIRATAGEAALRALGLGKERFDPLDFGIDAGGHARYCRGAAGDAASGPPRRPKPERDQAVLVPSGVAQAALVLAREPRRCELAPMPSRWAATNSRTLG